MIEYADIPLRTVAFLDILGFKAKLFDTPLFELVYGYERRIHESHFMNRPFDPTGQTPTLFNPTTSLNLLRTTCGAIKTIKHNILYLNF